jgi:hypothetical protein
VARKTNNVTHLSGASYSTSQKGLIALPNGWPLPRSPGQHAGPIFGEASQTALTSRLPQLAVEGGQGHCLIHPILPQ